ncbi:MAG TPA: serine hydrolase domain-containing protein [Fimbriiglobus sp.]
MRRNSLLVFLCVPAVCFGQAPPASPMIRASLQKYVDSGDISGAVAVVGQADRLVACEAIGQADLAAKTPMAADALFRIASMTKPITAIGIMMLADEGRLNVNDKVEKYLPEFKNQMLVAKRDFDTLVLKKPARPIAIKDLLTHTSGLPGGYPAGLSDLYTKRNRTLAEAALVMSQRPLEFEPGSKWAYCNTGMDTLGRIIEVVSGKSYEQFLQVRLFDRLGMNDTTFYPSAEQLKRVATLYRKPQNGPLKPAANPLIKLTKGAKFPIPAGGLFSTGSNLATLYSMMLHRGAWQGKRLLSEAAVAEMTKVQTDDLPNVGFVPGSAWGLGWSIVKEPQGVTAMLSPGTFGHGGAFGTQAWIDPAQNLFVVLLIQRTGLANSDASPMRQSLQEAAVRAIK